MVKRLFPLLLALLCWQCATDPAADPAPAPAPPPVVQSKTELLTGKNWKLTAASANPAYDYFGNQRRITNIYGFLNSCTRDDVYRYDEPNVFTHSDGPQVCGGLIQTGSFKWAFNSDETKITHFLGPVFANEVWEVELLTADKLVLIQKKTEAGNIHTLKFEYTRQ